MMHRPVTNQYSLIWFKLINRLHISGLKEEEVVFAQKMMFKLAFAKLSAPPPKKVIAWVERLDLTNLEYWLRKQDNSLLTNPFVNKMILGRKAGYSMSNTKDIEIRYHYGEPKPRFTLRSKELDEIAIKAFRISLEKYNLVAKAKLEYVTITNMGYTFNEYIQR